VLYHVADALIRMLTPILSFTAEEAYSHLPKPEGSPVTSQLLMMPQVDPTYLDEDLAAEWARLMEVREAVQVVLERARVDKMIGSSQEAAVNLYASADGPWAELLNKHLPDLPAVFIVSDVKLFVGGQSAPSGTYFGEGPGDLTVEVVRASGEKCERCWNYRKLGVIEQHPTLCERCAGVVLAQNLREA